jgi:hypothetical protein
VVLRDRLGEEVEVGLREGTNGLIELEGEEGACHVGTWEEDSSFEIIKGLGLLVVYTTSILSRLTVQTVPSPASRIQVIVPLCNPEISFLHVNVCVIRSSLSFVSLFFFFFFFFFFFVIMKKKKK